MKEEIKLFLQFLIAFPAIVFFGKDPEKLINFKWNSEEK